MAMYYDGGGGGDGEEECPPQHVKHLTSCYFFGSHSSFDGAQEICKKDGGTLANVSPKNNKWILDKMKENNPADHWIGSYYQGERIVRKKGPMNCPIMKHGPNRFGGLSCNSAYPFVCEKVMEVEKATVAPRDRPSRKYGNGDSVFDFDDFDDEEVTTVATNGEGSNSSSNSAVLGFVVCLLLLVAVAIAIRCYFRRTRERKARKMEEERRKRIAREKAELEKKLEEDEKKEQKAEIDKMNIEAAKTISTSTLKPVNIVKMKSQHSSKVDLITKNSMTSYKPEPEFDNLAFEDEEKLNRNISTLYRNRRLPLPPPSVHRSTASHQRAINAMLPAHRRSSHHHRRHQSPPTSVLRHAPPPTRGRSRSERRRRRGGGGGSPSPDDRHRRGRSAPRRAKTRSPSRGIRNHRQRDKSADLRRRQSYRSRSRGRSRGRRRSPSSPPPMSSSLSYDDSSGYETRSCELIAVAADGRSTTTAPSTLWTAPSLPTTHRSTVAPFGSEFATDMTTTTAVTESTAVPRRSDDLHRRQRSRSRHRSRHRHQPRHVTESEMSDSSISTRDTIHHERSRHHHRHEVAPTSSSHRPHNVNQQPIRVHPIRGGRSSMFDPPPPSYHQLHRASFPRHHGNGTDAPHHVMVTRPEVEDYDPFRSRILSAQSFVDPSDLMPMTSPSPRGRQHPLEVAAATESSEEDDDDDRLDTLDNIIAQPLTMVAQQRLAGQSGPIRVQRQIYESFEGSGGRADDDHVYESIDRRGNEAVATPNDLADHCRRNETNDEDDDFHQNLPPLPDTFY